MTAREGNGGGTVDPYLLIPWILGIGTWFLARQRAVEHPVRWGVVFFLIGCAIVLAIDLTQP
jgi:hypothetical protein